MQSKTSFFNGTLLRKNLTRFAPVWGLYTLCLVVGLFLEYANYELNQFWFAYHLGETINIMAMVNAGYALLVAQLLFGDLYSSRMCNMLHALPLRREGWFLTNLASALVMSLVPTAVMTIFSWVLLANTIFQNAWVISLGLFLASNLLFLVFFGLAAFTAMCTANRFAMAAGYGLLNFGAELAYFLVDTIYTPMLYGVVTPRALVSRLTPLESLVNGSYFTTTTFEEVVDESQKLLPGAVASFQFAENWGTLLIWTMVGLVFLALALVLYRKRHLECAGDAVAFPILKPVFNVLCTLFVMTAAVFVPTMILNVEKGTFLFLALGLVVGWFLGKMLLERSTRVFRLKNWYGLAALALCTAVSLGCTKLDIFGIVDYRPAANQIESVFLISSGPGAELDSPEDIETILHLHQLALEEPLEDSGIYVMIPDVGYVEYGKAYEQGYQLEDSGYDYTYVSRISLKYILKNGKQISRNYNIWAEKEAGEIVRELTSRWECVTGMEIYLRGEYYNLLEKTMENFLSFSFHGSNEIDKNILGDITYAQGLLEAIRKDCAEGTMSQNGNLHTGYFRFPDEDSEEGYYDRTNLYVDIHSERYGWDISIYPDSRHTLAYLQQFGTLDCQIIPGRRPL